MHIPKDDTAALLQDMHELIKSWRKVAEFYNYPETYAATLSGVARQQPGSISEKAEQELRSRMGLYYKKPRRLVRPVATDEQNARRAQLGATWQEVIAAGLAYYEEHCPTTTPDGA